MKTTNFLPWILFTIGLTMASSNASSSNIKSTKRSFIPPNLRDDYGSNFYPENPRYSNPHDINPSYTYRVNQIPSCSNNITEPFCLVDREYPIYDALEAYQKFKEQILESFGGIFNVDTEKSVDSLTTFAQETYLCPANIRYVKLLRAMDISGRWRIILNVIGFQQVVRLETCTTAGTACPAIATCFTTRCLQKYVYQRLVVYDKPYDHYYNPFSVATFKLPSSCCCKTG